MRRSEKKAMTEKTDIFENPRAPWMLLASSVTVLESYDWQKLIDEDQRAHNIGAVLDPTNYREYINNPRVKGNLEIAKALLNLIETYRAHYPEIKEVTE